MRWDFTNTKGIFVFDDLHVIKHGLLENPPFIDDFPNYKFHFYRVTTCHGCLPEGNTCRENRFATGQPREGDFLKQNQLKAIPIMSFHFGTAYWQVLGLLMCIPGQDNQDDCHVSTEALAISDVGLSVQNLRGNPDHDGNANGCVQKWETSQHSNLNPQHDGTFPILFRPNPTCKM